MAGPYSTEGNPDHPGVRGEPYRPTNLTRMGGKMDNPGTGTFPPHMQGVHSKAQPAGLSQTTQEMNMAVMGQTSARMQEEHRQAMMNENKEEGDKEVRSINDLGMGTQEFAPNQPTVLGMNQAVDVPEVEPAASEEPVRPNMLRNEEDEDGE